MVQRSAAALSGSAAALFLSLFLPVSNSTAGITQYVSQWLPAARTARTVRRMPEVPTRGISFETTEGTFMNVDASADGTTLVFDLLGDLYSMPIDGGDAIPLTSGIAWDQAPRFSPDGTQIYFVSDREGYKNLWQLSLGDNSLEQVTFSDSDILGGPNWSQDGSRLLAGVAVAAEPNYEIILHAVHPISGAMTRIANADGPLYEAGRRVRRRNTIYSGAESAGGYVYYSEALYLGEDANRKVVRLFVFDAKSQTHTPITPADANYSDFKPQLSHDGQRLAYYRQYTDRRTELRIRNRTTGEDAALVELADADDAEYTQSDDARPNYAFTPDDDSVIFWHGGKIRRVNLVDGSMQTIPFRVSVQREVATRVKPTVQRFDEPGNAATIRWPSLSRDGKTLVFAAVGYVWVMDTRTGDVRRLSDSDDFEYMPAISPDGSSVAYVSFSSSDDGYGFGRLMVASLAGGQPTELLAQVNEDFLLPKWSADGSKIAVIREGDRRTGTKAVFGWTPAASGIFNEVASAAVFSTFANLFVYARSVGFDAAGRKLLFSYPRSRTETVLVAADLEAGTLLTLAVGTSEVGGITPAPDLKHLVLTRRDKSVWLIPFEADEETTTVSSLAPDARRVSENGGYYVDWNDPDHLTFGFGKTVYRNSLQDAELQTLRVEVPVAKPEVTQVTAFTGARLITMSGDVGAGSVIESGTVLMDGTRIVALGPVGEVAVPAEALVIDATGKTIMPGLLDTHYHKLKFSALALPGFNFSDSTAISFGVTSAWSPGSQMDDGAPAIADLQIAGRVVGPRWSHAAQGAVGYPYQFLTSYANALAAAERGRDLGVFVLKEYNAPTREQRQWLSAAARESGLGIVSHLQSFEGTMTRIVDGYTGGDHPYFPVPFYKDVFELLRQTGFIWTPNLMITPGTTGAQADRARFYCNAAIQKQNKRASDRTEVHFTCDPDDHQSPSVNYDAHRISHVAEYVALAANKGVRIGVSAHNAPGSELHREMWFLWKGGMPIEDVLRAATVVSAEKLGLQEEIGSLEVGKMADFIVLDDNPLDDILNTLSLKYTVQGGIVYDSATAKRLDLTSIANADTAQLR